MKKVMIYLPNGETIKIIEGKDGVFSISYDINTNTIEVVYTNDKYSVFNGLPFYYEN